VRPQADGDPRDALTDRAAYGLAPGQEARLAGPGDARVLAAVAELRALQAEGLVRRVGLTGFPLPTLLRLALLVLHTPPFRPLDALLSYCHGTLQNNTLAAFAEELRVRARVAAVLTASPLSMGLLSGHPPPWHPAPPALMRAVDDAHALCAHAGGLPAVALGFAFRAAAVHGWPSIVGFSSLDEVHAGVRAWRAVQSDGDGAERERLEDEVRELFRKTGYLDWSWPSPGP
jgi:D-arabinose 1-dehydrogenase